MERFKHENLTYKVIVCLLYCTGIRRSELIKLNCDNINYNQNKIKILDAKGGKNRKIKIGGNLEELLLEYRKALDIYKGALIRGVQGRKRISKNSLQNIVKGLFKKAKIDRPGLTIHSFKHSYITNVSHKVGIKTAQKNVGHSRIDTTENYVHLTDKDMEEAIIDIPLQKPDSGQKY